MPRETTSSDYLHRLAQAEALELAGINPYPAEPPVISHKITQLLARFEELQGSTVSVAGRMLPKRTHGGVIFAHIDDDTARIQAAFLKNRMPDMFPHVKSNFEEGDFVGITGVLDTTRAGERSIWAEEVRMLTKALRFPPESVLDAETQQRQRYLHTLVNLESRERFRTRSRISQMMREYFVGTLGCLEVETPILDSTYGGALARPFVTHHRALDTDFYLRIANELYLKRYTVGGYYGGVFEFSRDFRNEGMDRTHNPEFTQVELYKPFWDYNNMMAMTEDLMSQIAFALHGTYQVPYGERVINYKTPWRRLTVYDGLRQKLGIEPTNISDKELRGIGQNYGVDKFTRGEIMLALFEELWEDELIDPTFVMDYPDDTSALTKRHRTDPSLTERFELFVGGMETANCYTELNDPRDQRARLEKERERRIAGDKETMPMDEDFILAQEYGMPQQAGIGISIDRWTMLLTNASHIRQAIYFPTLKPIVKE